MQNFEFIDIAENAIKTLEKISHNNSYAILHAGGLPILIKLIDFFVISVQVAILTIYAFFNNFIKINFFKKKYFFIFFKNIFLKKKSIVGIIANIFEKIPNEECMVNEIFPALTSLALYLVYLFLNFPEFY